ncbi:hypothetical protein G210_2346 [Candida maltosa Xu316]|uniref:F-box domain-containing protein n=1 Tax=Candida maltosa (strain Xu316) TaxID=1245528 RepID=M3HIZ5_CANMX|nr:hypothetical protein G210_2346 [Candida maltosa Xu316]
MSSFGSLHSLPDDIIDIIFSYLPVSHLHILTDSPNIRDIAYRNIYSSVIVSRDTKKQPLWQTPNHFTIGEEFKNCDIIEVRDCFELLETLREHDIRSPPRMIYFSDPMDVILLHRLDPGFLESCKVGISLGDISDRESVLRGSWLDECGYDIYEIRDFWPKNEQYHGINTMWFENIRKLQINTTNINFLNFFRQFSFKNLRVLDILNEIPYGYVKCLPQNLKKLSCILTADPMLYGKMVVDRYFPPRLASLKVEFKGKIFGKFIIDELSKLTELEIRNDMIHYEVVIPKSVKILKFYGLPNFSISVWSNLDSVEWHLDESKHPSNDFELLCNKLFNSESISSLKIYLDLKSSEFYPGSYFGKFWSISNSKIYSKRLKLSITVLSKPDTPSDYLENKTSSDEFDIVQYQEALDVYFHSMRMPTSGDRLPDHVERSLYCHLAYNGVVKENLIGHVNEVNTKPPLTLKDITMETFQLLYTKFGLTNLRYLSVSDYPGKYLIFEFPPSVTELELKGDISHQNFGRLCFSENLEKLVLQSIKFQWWPNLPKLRKLKIDYTDLDPTYLQSLPNTLEYLDLSRNHLNLHLLDLRHLVNLKYLNLSSVRYGGQFSLSKLPKSITHLYLCRLYNIQVVGKFARFENLQELDISERTFVKFVTIDDKYFGPNIRYFSCYANDISGSFFRDFLFPELATKSKFRKAIISGNPPRQLEINEENAVAEYLIEYR